MDVLALMHATEAAVVAGRQGRVSRAALQRAASVVHAVLAACEGGGDLRRRGAEPPLSDSAVQNPNAGANAG
jgi:hypothetical protein